MISVTDRASFSLFLGSLLERKTEEGWYWGLWKGSGHLLSRPRVEGFLGQELPANSRAVSGARG